MKKLPRHFWTLALVEACIVAAVFGWQFYVGTSAYLAHPPDRDLYAHDWSFQAVVFSLYAVPRFLLIMTALFVFDWFALRLIKTDERPSA
jgi:hypothetical protein